MRSTPEENTVSGSVLAKVAACLRQHQLLTPGARLGVAVSGGADSVALLCALQQLSPEWAAELSVVHVDHGLRPQSRCDAEFVASLAARSGLALHSRTLRLAQQMQPGDNLEQEARSARYGFFDELLSSGAVTHIATAHTADDQAETVLMRLLRGSATRGLAGIWPRLSRPGGCIIRPFLKESRSELRVWLREMGQPWCEDESNLDVSRMRSRIRHELLPLLQERFAAGVVGVLAAAAEIARQDEEWLEAESSRVAAALWSCDMDDDGQSAIWRASRSALRGLPEALCRRVVREGIQACSSSLRNVSSEKILQLVSWLHDAERHPRHLRFRDLDLMVTSREITIRHLK